MLAALKNLLVGILMGLGVTAPAAIVAVVPTPTPTIAPTPTPTPEPLRSVQLVVPFTSQAPFGEWSDPRQQDACEEASVMMAVFWATKKQIPSKQFAKDTLLDMSAYQMERWGSGVDTTARDTADRLIQGYFQYSKFRVVDVMTSEDVVRDLMRGNLVIVPTNGKLLHNPNFTHGGPERHNLVVKGYDLGRRQFITNDPGTRQGENYRYDEDVLFNAIRDYPTGDHEPIVHTNKVMISVTSEGP